MKWWPRRCAHRPLLSDEELAERCAAATEAREETARIGERIAARAPAVAAASVRWVELRERNHYGDLITRALRGRET